MNGLDLFSGIGGIGLGLSEYVRTVCYCEQDRYAQGVLLSRMQSGEIDTAPIWDDIRTLRADMLPAIDIIFGGFPCQDISVAGRGAGLAGERSGLFYEIVRLAKEIRPAFLFLENVPAIRTRGLASVCVELASLGYDLRWTVISASSVGAPHKRERWFLLAHSNNNRRRKQIQQVCELRSKEPTNIRSNGEVQLMADSMREGLEGQPKTEGSRGSRQLQTSHESLSLNREWWATEPNVGRVANGVQNRVDRIKCLGNSVVPLQVKTAFERLIGL